MSSASQLVLDLPEPPRRTFEYSVVPGLFRQHEPDFDPKKEYNEKGMLPHFGLMNKTWAELNPYVDELQRTADAQTTYRLLYMVRHGQGYHNFAEIKYGTPAWDDYWSKLDGDGTITWVDAELTPLGVSQAQNLSTALAHEAKAGELPLPGVVFVSPLQRALNTCQIVWDDLVLSQGTVPTIKETLREIMGVHTCDKRSNKSTIASRYPSYRFVSPFSETDLLWSATERESHSEEEVRLRAALDDVFSTLAGETTASNGTKAFSIVGHNGMANALFRVIGHRESEIPTGGLVPVVVKAVAKSS